MPEHPPAFEIFNAGSSPRLIFVCDHASNALPAEYGTLGLRPEVFSRHIAYDIGAAALTRALAASFGAPAILGAWSRLLVDLNRGDDDPTLVMKLSGGEIVPANAAADDREIRTRLERFYRPYHQAIAAEIARATAAGIKPVIVSIHSFTPAWRGVKRPWHVGVLWSRRDGRLARHLLEVLRVNRDFETGDNQPYSGELEGDCMDRHALANGLPHALLEIRQDLIADDAGVSLWAARLGPVIAESLARLQAGKNSMTPDQQAEIEAAVFRRLVAHLQGRTDVQNIDLMNLAGFCRNCLGDWFREAAAAHGLEFAKDEARARIYGMPPPEWKARYQKEASPEQLAAFAKSHRHDG